MFFYLYSTELFAQQAMLSDLKSVKIGDQVWTTENLNVSTFRNGDTIPEAKTYEEWEAAGALGKPAWCYQANLPEYGRKYGKLYNWYAVNDERGLAPKGWHVPSNEERNNMIDVLGGEISSKKMKSTHGWKNIEEGKSGNGSNESGFSAFAGSYRSFDGIFYSIGYIGI